MRHKRNQKSVSSKQEDSLRIENFEMIYRLIKKYERGECNRTELEAIESINLLNDKKLWCVLPQERLPEGELDKMHNRQYGKIAKNIEAPQQQWAYVKNTPEVQRTEPEKGIHILSKKKRFVLSKHLSVAVACVAITLGLSIILFQQDREPIEKSISANQQYISTTLPDGTAVYLNKGSKLSFSENFNTKDRRVKMSGEIFFDVKKDKTRPFIITHGILTTIVKGTSFTISNYQSLAQNVLTVHEGVVSIKSGDRQLALLTPNQRMVYNKEKHTFSIKNTDAKQLASWTEGGLVFADADVAEIRLRLQQYFSLNVTIKENAFLENGKETIRFNAQFSKGVSIDEVMEHLKLLYNVDYSLRGNSITIYKNQL